MAILAQEKDFQCGFFFLFSGRFGAITNIATHCRILYNFTVEYPFPPVGIVGAADGKNRRAFFFFRD